MPHAVYLLNEESYQCSVGVVQREARWVLFYIWLQADVVRPSGDHRIQDYQQLQEQSFRWSQHRLHPLWDLQLEETHIHNIDKVLRIINHWRAADQQTSLGGLSEYVLPSWLMFSPISSTLFSAKGPFHLVSKLQSSSLTAHPHVWMITSQ